VGRYTLHEIVEECYWYRYPRDIRRLRACDVAIETATLLRYVSRHRLSNDILPKSPVFGLPFGTESSMLKKWSPIFRTGQSLIQGNGQ
jgi:hypothetical protein